MDYEIIGRTESSPSVSGSWFGCVSPVSEYFLFLLPRDGTPAYVSEYKASLSASLSFRIFSATQISSPLASTATENRISKETVQLEQHMMSLTACSVPVSFNV